MKYPIINSFLLLVSMLVLSCASNRPLPSRGLSEDERRHYVIQNGYGITKEVKEAFLEGFTVVDMNQELVFQLYGPPDRTSELDTRWEYVNGKGDLITGFKFEEKKIKEIFGDPRGGVPLPQAGQ